MRPNCTLLFSTILFTPLYSIVRSVHFTPLDLICISIRSFFPFPFSFSPFLPFSILHFSLPSYLPSSPSIPFFAHQLRSPDPISMDLRLPFASAYTILTWAMRGTESWFTCDLIAIESHDDPFVTAHTSRVTAWRSTCRHYTHTINHNQQHTPSITSIHLYYYATLSVYPCWCSSFRFSLFLSFFLHQSVVRHRDHHYAIDWTDSGGVLVVSYRTVPFHP